DAPPGGHQVGGVGEVGGEERAADHEVERGQRVEPWARAAEEDEGRERDDVQGAGREEHAAAAEAIEERAHRRAEPHAHREPAAEHEPDGELVAAERADEEREEEEHAQAHRAREMDGARDPEGARVEPRGGVHARGCPGVGSGGRRRMREIVDGIFIWSWFSEPNGYDFNGYLIREPGKSPGEIALHSPRRRILIVGDAVIGNPPGKLSLLREKVMDDPPLLRASVAALAALEVEVLLPGDGAPILRDAGARLRELA